MTDEVNRTWMSISMHDMIVDLETAGQIISLLDKVKGYKTQYKGDGVDKYYIGGQIYLHTDLVSPERYAEGLINGPKPKD